MSLLLTERRGASELEVSGLVRCVEGRVTTVGVEVCKKAVTPDPWESSRESVEEI